MRAAVEIAVVDLASKVLFESLVNPEYPVSASARAKHQLSDAELAQAPERQI
jgi:DNA polymerase III epsilon subunit-like protein